MRGSAGRGRPNARRRVRRGVFIGLIALVLAMLGALADRHHLEGFLVGGLGGIFIGVALLAWPTESDYPKDGIDRTFD